MRLGLARQMLHGDERLALGGEGDLDGVVHAAAADDFDVRAVGPAAEDPRGLALQRRVPSGRVMSWPCRPSHQ